MVTGTYRKDMIEFDRRTGTRLKVEINRREQNFNFASVTKVVVQALDGNDVVEFNDRNPITLPAEIHGGMGKDSLEGAQGRDTICGENGNDDFDNADAASEISTGHPQTTGQTAPSSCNDVYGGGTNHRSYQGLASSPLRF